MAGSLQQFIPLLATQVIKKRIQLGSDILSCLKNPSCLQDFEEIGFFIDSVSSWLSNSNFKVAQNGIEIMTILAEEMKEEFKPYISTIFPATVDRLGDGKDQVRLQAKGLMLKLMNPVSSPQYVFDKLSIAFNHKNFRVREEVMVLLQQTLDIFGSSAIVISRLMPSLVKLLGDPNSQVRDTTMQTLVHVYKHVGDPLRHDLSKRAGIPPPKLQLLCTKFDEVKAAGALLPSALERAATPAAPVESAVAAQPDYSAAWAEYYKSLGMIREGEMTGNQAKTQMAVMAPQLTKSLPEDQYLVPKIFNPNFNSETTNTTNYFETVKPANSDCLLGRKASDSDLSRLSVDSGVIVDLNKDLISTAIRNVEKLTLDIKYSQLAMQLARLLLKAENIINAADNNESLTKVRSELLNLLSEAGILNMETAVLFNNSVSLPFHPNALENLIPKLTEFYLLNLSTDPSEQLKSIIKTVKTGILCSDATVYFSYPSRLHNYLMVKNSCRNDYVEQFAIAIVSLEEHIGHLSAEDKAIISKLLEVSLVPFLELVMELKICVIDYTILNVIMSCIKILQKMCSQNILDEICSFNLVKLDIAEKVVYNIIENMVDDYIVSEESDDSSE